MLSSVPKCKKAVMCLIEKIPVCYKFGSDMNYGIAGHEFHVHESTIYIKEGVFTQKHT